MYCQSCAKEIDLNAEICSACGTPTVREKAASGELSDKLRVASRDAVAAFKVFSISPVGGLPPAFESLDKPRARGVGIAFVLVFALCVAFGTYMALPGWGKPDIGGIFGLLILGTVPPVVIASVSALARKLFDGSGSLESDIFIAGASLLPAGFAVFIAGIIGMGNIEAVAIVGTFGGCYTILILYTGCTRITKITDAQAALTVPVMLLLSMWAGKVVFTSVVR
jgi:hypothetical protein